MQVPPSSLYLFMYHVFIKSFHKYVFAYQSYRKERMHSLANGWSIMKKEMWHIASGKASRATGKLWWVLMVLSEE